MGSELSEKLVPPSIRRGGKVDKSLFEDLLHWAQNSITRDKAQLPADVLLRLILAEWQAMTDYINTRLNQISWEIEHPNHFGTGDRRSALDKLHIWRRWVPVCREMLSETLRQGNEYQLWNPSGQEGQGVMQQYAADFKLSLGFMEEYQQRIDNLTAVVTAVISIEDAERNAQDSKNVRNLTILATLFIPPTFFATLFSMTDGPLSELSHAMKWWAVASVPSIILLLFTFWLLQGPRVEPALQSARRVLGREGGNSAPRTPERDQSKPVLEGVVVENSQGVAEKSDMRIQARGE